MNRDEYICSGHWLTHKYGEELPHSKLTKEKARQIRAEHKLYCRINGAPGLAKRYGLHRRTIEKVLRYETWRNA